MKKRIFGFLTFCFALALLLQAMVLEAVGAEDLSVTVDTGETVTLKDTDADGYYEIGTADELYAFAAAVNGGSTEIKAALTADITVNSGVIAEMEKETPDPSAFRVWTPIKEFEGSFDGRGHTVSGLYLADGSTNNVGLFGLVYGYSAVEIKSLSVTDSYFLGAESVGLIAGKTLGSRVTISDCSVSGAVYGTKAVGGLVGYFYDGTNGSITDCVSSVSVTASGNSAGGLVGQIFNQANFLRCQNSGSVLGVNRVGGIVGYVQHEAGQITSCQNTGDITGASFVGGIAGEAAEDTVSLAVNRGRVSGDAYVGGIAGMGTDVVIYSYNEGDVVGTDQQVGGLVGYAYATALSHSYNGGDVSGKTLVGGLAGTLQISSATACYSIGSVSGTSTKNIGCAFGANYGSTLQSVYYLPSNALSGIGNGADVVGQLDRATAQDFASGAVAYTLSTYLPSDAPVSWSQRLGGDAPDAYPVFGDSPVYRGYEGCDVRYGNTAFAVTAPAHSYNEAGFCTVALSDGGTCDAYQPATLDGDVYLIDRAGKLYWYAAVVNRGYEGTAQNPSASARLTADIILNTDVLTDGALTENTAELRPWSPIGTESGRFNGTFDGDGHTVSGLYINGTEDCVGLFGSIGGATITDLRITDSYVKGGRQVAILVGRISGASISRCTTDATVVGSNYVGGLVGYAASGSISDSVFEGHLTGESIVGGVVGHMYQMNVIGCGFVGTVVINGSGYAGGVVGYSYNSFSTNGNEKDPHEIRDCYALGTIEDRLNMGRVGGIVAGTGNRIVSCYSDVTVVGKPVLVGMLAAEFFDGGSITDSYYPLASGRGGLASGGFEYGRRAEAIASGEVAYLLGSAWGQTIGTDPRPVLGGATVYAARNTSCIGTPSDTYTYSNDEGVVGIDGVHDYTEYGLCELCEVKLTGASLALGVDLTVKYYAKLHDLALLDTESGEQLAVIFKVNGVSRTVLAEPSLSEDGEYVFAYTGIAPNRMGDSIDATLVVLDRDGGTVKSLDDHLGYSVKKNAEALLKEHADDAALVQLVSDLLKYGAAAQSYTDYRTDAPVDADLSLTPSGALPSESDNLRLLVTHVESEVRFLSANVWFDAVNRIGVTLSKVDGVTLRVNGEPVSLTGTTYYTDAISATEFAKAYTFTLYEGETLVQTLTYSVNSYAFVKMGETEEDGVTPTEMATLALSLYRYGSSADAYVNPKPAPDLLELTDGTAEAFSYDGKTATYDPAVGWTPIFDIDHAMASVVVTLEAGDRVYYELAEAGAHSVGLVSTEDPNLICALYDPEAPLPKSGFIAVETAGRYYLYTGVDVKIRAWIEQP